MGESPRSRIFKAAVVNSTSEVPVTVAFEGVLGGTRANLTWLTQSADAGLPDGLAQNVLDGPDVVATQTKELRADSSGKFSFSLPNLSVAVLATE